MWQPQNLYTCGVRFAACTVKILFAGIIPIIFEMIISEPELRLPASPNVQAIPYFLAAFGLLNINIMQAAAAIVPKNVIIAF